MLNKTGRMAAFFLAGAIMLAPMMVRAQSDDIQADVLLNTYMDLVASGNYESARGLWMPGEVERAERLGITYDGIPLKVDCGSPVVYATRDVREWLNRGGSQKSILDSGVVRLTFNALIDSQRVTHNYFARKLGNDFWFITPEDYYASKWPVKESKYFRFHINPAAEAYYNDYAVKSLDDFVDETAAKIIIPAPRMALLAQKKIDYYLCASETEVGQISGNATKGVYDLASDAIITCIFPHYHEVGHLLVNFRFQNIPLFTRSIMQEGFAVWLGGRWQRSPEVMLDFGDYILKYEIADLDSILVEGDTSNPLGADINYPVAACFTEYLVSTLGMEKSLALYRSLSGDFHFIRSKDLESSRQVLTAATGLKWEDLKAAFSKYSKARGPKSSAIFPGETTTEKPAVSDAGLEISTSNKFVKVEYRPDTSFKAEISYLFAKDPAMKDKKSTIFDEQYKGTQKFEGYRYGIRLDRNEIGLYDYYTNQLIAKYVYDFNPSPNFYDSAAGRFSVYFNRTVLGNSLPDLADHIIIK